MVYQGIVIVYFTFAVSSVLVLENGLARTPPMGWMSWGFYMCGTDCEHNPEKCLNEELIISVVDSFFDEGFQEAGYEYIIIDDCWSEKTRDEHGRLVPDRTRFPHGMGYIANYIHNRGLKFGMYTNIAAKTCMQYPGSKNHFKIDAETFAAWGVDYLKVDGCFVTEDYLNTAYIDLGKELNKTGKPMVYSCSWPYYIEFIHNKKPDYGPVAKHCNMWRNFHDMSLNWQFVLAVINWYEKMYDDIAKYHKPGQWNDPDMLLFGTKTLSERQSRVQLSVYAMLSAPLLLSCDMRNITPYEKQLLQNMDLIAIAQDLMGVMAKPYKLHNSITLWVKPHLPMKGDSYPSYSFLFVNLIDSETSVFFSPWEYGLNSTDGYSIMDVFSLHFLSNVTLNNTILVRIPYQDNIEKHN